MIEAQARAGCLTEFGANAGIRHNVIYVIGYHKDSPGRGPAPRFEQASSTLGREDGGAYQAARYSLGGWLRGRKRSPVRTDGGERHVYQAERGAVAGMLLRPFGRQRCGAGGGSDVHLLTVEGQRRADQQLGESV